MPSSTDCAPKVRDRSEPGTTYKRTAAARRSAGDRSNRVPRPRLRYLSPHAARRSDAVTPATRSTPAINGRAIMLYLLDVVVAMSISSVVRGWQAHSLDCRTERGIRADGIPRAIDVQKHEPGRARVEGLAKVVDGSIPVVQLRVGAGKVERRGVGSSCATFQRPQLEPAHSRGLDARVPVPPLRLGQHRL